MHYIFDTLGQLNKKLEQLNSKLDSALIKTGLKQNKIKITYFEKELAILIQEFLITYGAGITLERSLKLTLKSHCKDEDLIKLMGVNASAIEAINRFATHQDRKEIWRFVRLINQIHTTGASTSVSALEKYHDELWQNKLTQARMKSETVTIQLTFLLMLSLISVIMVVLTPVILMF